MYLVERVVGFSGGECMMVCRVLDSVRGEEHKGIFTEYYHLSFVYQHLGMLLISRF